VASVARGRFAHVVLGKLRAGSDSVLLKHRFSPPKEKASRRALPPGSKRRAKIAGKGNFLPSTGQIVPVSEAAAEKRSAESRQNNRDQGWHKKKGGAWHRPFLLLERTF
jgi:hypothetical protein